MHNAAWKDGAASIQVLLQAGADKDNADDSGRTSWLLTEDTSILRGFCSRRARTRTSPTTHSEQTPAMIAACNAYPECLRALLEAGADMSVRDQAGKTTLLRHETYNSLELMTEWQRANLEHRHDEVVAFLRSAVGGDY